MKRSVLVVMALLLFLAVPQIFADTASQLILSSGGMTCTVTVDDATPGAATLTPTAAGDCNSLTASTDGVTHGQLIVQTKKGFTFNNLTITDTADGFNDSTLPLLQNFNTVEVNCGTPLTCTSSNTLHSVFTDTAADEPSPSDLCVQGSVSCLLVAPSAFNVAVSTTALTLAGTVNYFGLATADGTSDGDVLPATDLFSQFLNEGGPSSSKFGTFANKQGGPYSLTSQIDINFKTNGTIDASQQISVGVPEPASIVFMGTMLLFASAGLRRKFARK